MRKKADEGKTRRGEGWEEGRRAEEEEESEKG